MTVLCALPSTRIYKMPSLLARRDFPSRGENLVRYCSTACIQSTACCCRCCACCCTCGFLGDAIVGSVSGLFLARPRTWYTTVVLRLYSVLRAAAAAAAAAVRGAILLPCCYCSAHCCCLLLLFTIVHLPPDILLPYNINLHFNRSRTNAPSVVQSLLYGLLPISLDHDGRARHRRRASGRRCEALLVVRIYHHILTGRVDQLFSDSGPRKTDGHLFYCSLPSKKRGKKQTRSNKT